MTVRTLTTFFSDLGSYRGWASRLGTVPTGVLELARLSLAEQLTGYLTSLEVVLRTPLLILLDMLASSRSQTSQRGNSRGFGGF